MLLPGPDEVPGGAHEEAGLHGRPAELHLAPQPRPPAGKPTVPSLGLTLGSSLALKLVHRQALMLV